MKRIFEEHHAVDRGRVQHHDRLAVQQAVLGAAEAEHVDAGVGGEGAQGYVESRRCVGDAGPVEVHEHRPVMRVRGDRGEFVN
jgi:hypothetical protein